MHTSKEFKVILPKYFWLPNANCMEHAKWKEAQQIEKNMRNEKQYKMSILTALSWEGVRLSKYVWKTRHIERYFCVSKGYSIFITMLTETKTLKYYVFRSWQSHLNVRKKPVDWKSNPSLFLFRAFGVLFKGKFTLITFQNVYTY